MRGREQVASREMGFHVLAASIQLSACSLFLSIEVDEQIWRFVDANPVQMSALQLRRQALPDRDCQILSCRNFSKELGNFLVQEAMIHRVKHLAVHHFLELLEVDHKS